jgi:hypothetical protein
MASGNQHPPSRAKPAAKKAKPRYWSAEVTRNSNALDLESGVFTGRTPGEVAKSLKRSAEASKRRKGSAYQSAMSMLNFYINRAGKSLPKSRLAVLNRAKGALRQAFGRD